MPIDQSTTLLSLLLGATLAGCGLRGDDLD